MMRPEKTVKLKSSGVVALKQLTRRGVTLFAVCYPSKFSGIETQQFFIREEADLCFYRYAEFFSGSCQPQKEGR